jgi:transglutaminase-like putative cysteine protease
MSQFIHPNKTMRDAAASLTMSAASDEEKARQIYDAVMKLDNTDFSRALPEDERRQRNLRAIRGAEDVWKQKSGKGDELALLYVALARAAGLTAWPMKVVNRDRALFNYYYASTRQMDDYIAIVEVGGQDVYVDPGQAMCPFGQLHWKHSMASA